MEVETVGPWAKRPEGPTCMPGVAAAQLTIQTLVETGAVEQYDIRTGEIRGAALHARHETWRRGNCV